jgi:hypothetical protein
LCSCLLWIECGHASYVSAWTIEIRRHVIANWLDNDGEDDRNIFCGLTDSPDRDGPDYRDDVNIESDNLECEFGKTVERSLRRT